MRFTLPTVLATCALAAAPFAAAAVEWTSALLAPTPPPLGPGPAFTFSAPLVAGASVEFQASGMTPGNLCQFVGSVSGGGPLVVPGIGTLDVTPPVFVSGLLPVDGAGGFAFTTPVPAALTGGNFWGNIVEWDAAGTTVQAISPGISEAIQ